VRFEPLMVSSSCVPAPSAPLADLTELGSRPLMRLNLAEFTWGATAAATLDVYGEVAEGRRRHRPRR
jgi:hypothetical protein